MVPLKITSNLISFLFNKYHLFEVVQTRIIMFLGVGISEIMLTFEHQIEIQIGFSPCN